MIANQVFGSGSSSRIFKRFRDKEGWSYGAGAMLNAPTKENAGAHMTYAILAPQLSSNEYWGRTMAWQAELEKKVAAVTPEQANAAFRKYVTPDAVSIFKAGDFKKAAAPTSSSQ